jgi:hypothetical protein
MREQAQKDDAQGRGVQHALLLIGCPRLAALVSAAAAARNATFLRVEMYVTLCADQRDLERGVLRRL